jgi:MSHA pilin protein MshC
MPLPAKGVTPGYTPGFTLVELIGVIAIAGILAMVAAPRFFSADTFAARGYFDAASGVFRYAQKLAIARHGDVAVLIDADGLTLCRVAVAPCAAADRIPGPDGDTAYRLTPPNGVTLTPTVASVSFDARGRPNAEASLSINDDPTLTLYVEAETGYVH